jgi:MurNAc alpha-1-phosphate uridylyltransferase
LKVMILAAGLGERMRPLTDVTPKVLLEVTGKPLIYYHLERLAKVGVTDVIVNICHLAEQLEESLGSGRQWGLNISFSRELEPLETAGGIIRALPLLGEQAFLIVNGDVWTDYPFEQLLAKSLTRNNLAHLVMIDNPPQHINGDFYLGEDGQLLAQAEPGAQARTYAGIGLYTADFFKGVEAGKLALKPLLDKAIAQGQISAEYYGGEWFDVGTPNRLAQLNQP